MKRSLAYIFTLLIILISCDDNTGTLGGSVVPDSDSVSINTATYMAVSRSIAIDSVLGKTNKVYLGRFTDPQTNSVFEADFIAQFNCEEGGNVFPETILGDSAVKVELRLFFTSLFGDPTNTMTAEVYELEQTLQEGAKYYTNIDPTQFYDTESKPLATKVYTATDYTLEDSELEDSEHYSNVSIPLPTEIGTEIIKMYREHKDFFANATSFIENVCKGYYVKAAQGDGTILYIDQASLDIYFQDTARSDSVFVTQFAGTGEVLQANRFNTEKLESLVKDSSCTYLKTPAGIFTEVTLPIDDIVINDDSINAAKIIFNCYNNTTESQYKFGIPQTLLMICKDEMHTFFEKNKLPDDISSFYTTHNSTHNCYEYSNIARLITHCSDKRQEWLDKNPSKSLEEYEQAYPNWNKVMLIPVTTTTDSNNYIVSFRHDFSLNSVRLLGGKDQIKIRVITSKFND